MKNYVKIFLIAAVFAYLVQAVFIANKYFGLETVFWGNALGTFIALCAVVVGIFAYRSIPKNNSNQQRAELLTVLAIFFFFLGDLIWFLSELLLDQTVPIGSWPDLFWNVAYLFLIVALGYLISEQFRSDRKLLIFLILGALILGGIYTFVTIRQDITQGVFSIAQAIQGLYPVYDLLLFFMIIYFIWPMVLSRNLLFVRWMIFSFAIVLRVIYDLIFASLTELNLYYTGHPLDLLYVLFYIGIIASISFTFDFKKQKR